MKGSLSGAITKGYDKESHQAVNGMTRLMIASGGGIISGVVIGDTIARMAFEAKMEAMPERKKTVSGERRRC